MKKYRIAILASGSGTNAEKIIQHFRDHDQIEVAIVISNNPDAYALTRAARLGLPTLVVSRELFRLENEFRPVFTNLGITHIVLAGFLWKIPSWLITAYPDRIINIHPALLPKYGGKGMYGLKVHEAVRASADRETGITIHLVNEEYDEGRILLRKSCPVEENYSAEEIAECVHRLEYEHYPATIEQWILGQIA